MNRISAFLSRQDLMARAIRGSGLTLLNFGGGALLRLVSNLILTRLLFPEVFGLMALVQVFVTGLQMFSDVGINTAIVQSKRGDDPDFLNTAWTLGIIRGLGLWLITCALAPFAAFLYSEPILLTILPAVGFSLAIRGFTTTKIDTETRHLRLGHQTYVSLGCQAVGLVFTTVLAVLLQSVWALVIGTLLTALTHVILAHLILPGIRNRLRWDWTSVSEIFGFGKFIFLSTMAGFMINQGDRAILGGFVSLEELGIYNIGLFLGTFALLLSRAVDNRVIFPLYRIKNPADDPSNLDRISSARRRQIAAMISLAVFLSFTGPFVADVLYDDRYALAGGIMTLFSFAIIPQLVLDGYSGAFLANGDSKRFFVLLLVTAIVQTGLLFIGVIWIGLFGAILSQGIATLLIYPIRIAFLKRYNAWDPKGDATLLSIGLGATALGLWINQDALIPLFH